MTKSNLPKIVLFGDCRKGDVSEVLEDFMSFVNGKARVIANCGIEECKVDILKEADYAVVFGGDGSIISAARQLSQAKAPVIGVNLGKLGFLAEFSVCEVKDYFDVIMAGKAHVEKRMILGCNVVSGGKEKFCSTAVNDVFITAGPPYRMIELKIAVDGQPLAGCVSDGLIISTPTGSTAYNLSAGGPILSSNMRAIVITPICPHSLSFRPIVINAQSTIEVIGIRLNEGTTVSIDGQRSVGLLTDETVKVKCEESDFLIVNNPIRTHWDTLATKLSWAKRPMYKKP